METPEITIENLDIEIKKHREELVNYERAILRIQGAITMMERQKAYLENQESDEVDE